MLGLGRGWVTNLTGGRRGLVPSSYQVVNVFGADCWPAGTGHRPTYVRKFVSYRVLAVSRWFPPGTPVSSTCETAISSSASPPRYDAGCC